MIFLSALVAGDASAATFAIDDSGTLASPSLAEARWLRPDGARGLSFEVEATVRVDVRLNLRLWVGRQANIYMSAPRSNTVPFNTFWTSQGRLLPGSLTQGKRASVVRKNYDSNLCRRDDGDVARGRSLARSQAGAGVWFRD